MIPFDILEHTSECLRTLAHPQRLRIVEILEKEEVPVGELAKRLDLPQAAVSQHLNLMKVHGLLGCHRKGRSVMYYVTNPHCTQIISLIRKSLERRRESV